MVFKDFKTKDSVVVVYTGEGKGKTSASLGMTARALGAGWKVAYVQFIKHWDVSEHVFLRQVAGLFKGKLEFLKGGKGWFNAGELSAKGVTKAQHKQAAQKTYEFALQAASSGTFDLVVCDEINNAVHDGLLAKSRLREIIKKRAPKTSLCLTGRNFPDELLPLVDIATNMTKIKHHYDDKYLANKGIDY